MKNIHYLCLKKCIETKIIKKQNISLLFKSLSSSQLIKLNVVFFFRNNSQFLEYFLFLYQFYHSNMSMDLTLFFSNLSFFKFWHLIFTKASIEDILFWSNNNSSKSDLIVLIVGI